MLTASATAEILSVKRNTVGAYFKEFCVKILGNSTKEHGGEFCAFE
ncbi:MAG: hypothetical protein IJ599_00065 [Alphaproteobacteria bacterium]|nr:hypothetical protein [Alphaproteobacteria bacterium]